LINTAYYKIEKLENRIRELKEEKNPKQITHVKNGRKKSKPVA